MNNRPDVTLSQQSGADCLYGGMKGQASVAWPARLYGPHFNNKLSSRMYDYIIIGAGSAGCVLANRLSENPENSVCLVEAGGSDKSPFIYTPLGVIASLALGLFNWSFNSKKQSSMKDREIYCPRGKVLGGSSSINAMLYLRGQAQDYDRWNENGCAGWSFSEVLPYFKKSQHQERGECDLHGMNGPLNVADGRSRHEINAAFVEAGMQVGEAYRDDFNGEVQEGVGWFQCTQKDGQRHSAAAAYLHPVMAKRKNLTVLTNTQTRKILFEGKKAVGVEVLEKKQVRQLKAGKEIILSAGSFGSPQLLLLSGVGPKEKLESHNITQHHDLPGVGENLQEHVDVLVVAKDRSSRSWAALRPLTLIRSVGEVFNYLFSRRGMLSTSITESGGFIRVGENAVTPDVQIHSSALAMDDHGRSFSYFLKYGYSLHACLLRPKSRGSVSLQSADPLADPIIDLNMLSDADDAKLLVKAVRRVREIMRAPALSKYTGDEIQPGPNCSSDAALDDFIRRKANHVYHPVGTCKMGNDDQAVVDERLRVRGLENLRVVDASIMPTIVSGNTNAPTLMIGERGAEWILQDHG